MGHSIMCAGSTMAAKRSFNGNEDAMRAIRMLATYLIIILSVIGIGACPPVL